MLFRSPSAVVVPLIAGVIDWLVNGRPARRVVVGVGPWLALAIPIIVVGRLVQPAHWIDAPAVYLRPIVAADALAFYVRQIIAPVHLAIDYGRSPEWLLASWQRWVTWIVPAAVLGIALLLRKRFRLLLAAAGVFVAGVLPMLGLVPFDFQSYSTVSDHYLYVAMLGPALLAAGLIDRWNGRRAYVIAGVLLLTLEIGRASCRERV